MSSKEHVGMTQGSKKDFDLNQLLHPARAFGHPQEVLVDPDLTFNEKRAILASWASDACAVEASSELRQPTDGPQVRFDDILDALKVLDKEVVKSVDYGRVINRARRIRDLYRRDNDDRGSLFG
jgi:hypothetical protein